jgi:hypothetical protein
MMVELDAYPVDDGTNAPNVVFSRKSSTRNMDFVRTSMFTREATIGTAGYGPAPMGRSAHEFLLQITTSEAKAASTRKKEDPAGGSSQLTWICEGYRATGSFIEISGKRYELYDPVGSFGYVASHEGQVARWQWELKGARRIGDNRYQLVIPPGRKATLRTRIAPIEYSWSGSLHGGAAIPLGSLAAGAAAGACALVDLGIPLTNWLVLEAVAGYYAFPSRPSGSQEEWFSLSANLKAYRSFVTPLLCYANVGLGGYMQPGDWPQIGANAGAGVSFRINRLMSAESGVDYHLVFGPCTQFLSVHAGLLFRF